MAQRAQNFPSLGLSKNYCLPWRGRGFVSFDLTFLLLLWFWLKMRWETEVFICPSFLSLTSLCNLIFVLINFSCLRSIKDPKGCMTTWNLLIFINETIRFYDKIYQVFLFSYKFFLNFQGPSFAFSLEENFSSAVDSIIQCKFLPRIFSLPVPFFPKEKPKMLSGKKKIKIFFFF